MNTELEYMLKSVAKVDSEEKFLTLLAVRPYESESIRVNTYSLTVP